MGFHVIQSRPSPTDCTRYADGWFDGHIGDRNSLDRSGFSRDHRYTYSARPCVCDRWSHCDVEREGTGTPFHSRPRLLLVLRCLVRVGHVACGDGWAENYHLFVFGALAFSSAWLGHRAIQKRWPYWTRMHITGMGLSYTWMLVAFYVDNGPQLPIWKDLPHFTYWLLPLAVGLPLIIRALASHPFRRLGDPT
jgi:hypothetical protein